MNLPNTSILMGGDCTEVTFYSTKIMWWDDMTLTLNSGGHRTRTPTTKKRINLLIQEYNLGGYKVIQRDRTWLVEMDDFGRTIPFTDGMTLKI